MDRKMSDLNILLALEKQMIQEGDKTCQKYYL